MQNRSLASRLPLSKSFDDTHSHPQSKEARALGDLGSTKLLTIA